MALYRRTVTYFGISKEHDMSAATVVDIDKGEAKTETLENYKVRYVKLTKRTTGKTELIHAIDDCLESKNSHAQGDLPHFMMANIEKVVGPEKAFEILWNMVQEKGLSLGL